MNITKDTKIRYTLRDKEGEEISMTFPIECVEGSTPNFYEQLRQMISDLEDFDIESSEIVERFIVIEGEDDEGNSN